MTIGDRKTRKIAKAYYQAERANITVPNCPVTPQVSHKAEIAGAILSFTLTTACLLFLVFAPAAASEPSTLAERIAVCAKSSRWDKALMNGIDHLKTGYNYTREKE